MSSSRPHITHVLFDNDGLLLDTESFYTTVQEQIGAKMGKTFTWEIKAKMMGKKTLESAQVYVKEMQIETLMTPEEFILQREAALESLFPTSQLMPGAERLLRHLHAHGIPMALATSSHTRHYNLKTQNHHQMYSLFDHITTGDAVSRGKPAPDIFEHAAQQWTPAPLPSACLVFEDAPAGVAAAKAAGMRVCLVPDPRLDSSHHGEADECLDSLLNFKPENYGLPPFTDELRQIMK